ncbi:hypothetical protein K492DRAFT_233851 [Lichtheimia hyalospora FSU 10163]|nr:hypothetical protein K492DRAFT_233851 [Lichtheimia hyalospora FSU 10163]
MSDSISPMQAESSSNAREQQQQQRQGLPVPIHPDDAKDKVFTAILKALLKMGNKPSSPKELANVIVKYKYATLGGATPFATVSSRISQHFKRAAQHNPPRPPLLAKHFDENHSRKINYSLATEPTSSSSPQDQDESPTTSVLTHHDNHKTLSDMSEDDTSREQQQQQPLRRSNRHASPPVTRASRRKTRQSIEEEEDEEEQVTVVIDEDDADDEADLMAKRRGAKRMRRHYHSKDKLPLSPMRDPIAHKNQQVLSRAIPPVSPPPTQLEEASDQDDDIEEEIQEQVKQPEEDESEVDEFPDYHEEMLKGDDAMMVDTTTGLADRRPSVNMVSSRRPSIAQATATGSSKYGESPRLTARRQSFSLNNGDEIWTTNPLEHDFDSVFLSDESTSTHAFPPLSIGAPESISMAELETYFTGAAAAASSNSSDKQPSSSSTTSEIPAISRLQSSRKSFSALMGTRETSLLQRALLASTAARGMAEAAAAAAAVTTEDYDDTPEDDLPSRQRRKSWPDESTTSGAILFPEDEDEQDKENKKDITTPLDDQQQQESSFPEPTSSTTETIQQQEQDEHFIIRKRTWGSLECYQLDSPDDIPDTKVLRFIASTDGATEHVALRTRHAADKNAKHRRNSHQHFYLGEGYVNATQLRKAARPVMGKGPFDAAGETEEGRVVVSLTKGPMDCRGAWVPLSRARELVKEYGIDGYPGITKLLGDDPMDGKEDEDEEDKEEQKQVDYVKKTSSKDGENKSTPTPPESEDPATSSLLSVDDGEFFVKFEEDEEKKTSDNTTTTLSNDATEEAAAMAAAAAAAATTMPLDLSKTFNLAALQQVSAAFPGVDLTKALTAYMQSVTSGKSDNPSTSATDIKAALARFPALEALLRKDPITTTNTNTTHNTTTPAIVNTDQQQQPVVVHTIMPTNPTMYITVADNVAVCIAVLAPPDANTPEYRIMRRLDTNYINGTALLTAGGIDTDSERSMILSFEMERRRIPEKKSALHGTWIPLRRAQELAVTCSIQHRLGPFLTDSIESYFPSPLPITIHRRPQLPSLKENSNNRWASLARRALRNGITHPDTDDAAASTSSSSTSNTKALATSTAAQLHQLLLTNNPRKIAEYAQKAPLLGTFGDDHENTKRKVAVIDASSVAARAAAAAAAAKKRAAKKRRLNEQVDHSSDVDIENSGSEAEVDDDEGEDTDTDTDVEEVRKRMKRMRDAAIDAMESGSSIDLEELIRRASSPIMSSGIDHRSGSNDTLRRTATVRATARRRPQARHGNSSGGKIAPSNLKKSASWSGSLTSPLRVVVPSKKSPTSNNNHRKSTNSLRPSKLRGSTSSNNTSHHDNNRVVEHTSSSSSPSPTLSKAEHTSDVTATTTATTTTITTPPTNDSSPSGDLLATIQEDDEDEEIDIGGSDRDDDLR